MFLIDFFGSHFDIQIARGLGLGLVLGLWLGVNLALY